MSSRIDKADIVGSPPHTTTSSTREPFSMQLSWRVSINSGRYKVLALDTQGGFGEMLVIINAKRGAFVVTEIELAVALQMLLAHVVINASDPVFQDQEIVLYRICMPEVAANIFLD
jgi:hypothetical protein